MNENHGESEAGTRREFLRRCRRRAAGAAALVGADRAAEAQEPKSDPASAAVGADSLPRSSPHDINAEQAGTAR